MKRTIRKTTAKYLRAGLGAAFVATWLPEAAYACDSCYGAAVDTPTTAAIRLAMVGMIVMTGVVWGGIGLFFYQARRRMQRLAPGAYVVNASGELVPKPGAEPNPG